MLMCRWRMRASPTIGTGLRLAGNVSKHWPRMLPMSRTIHFTLSISARWEGRKKRWLKHNARRLWIRLRPRAATYLRCSSTWRGNLIRRLNSAIRVWRWIRTTPLPMEYWGNHTHPRGSTGRRRGWTLPQIKTKYFRGLKRAYADRSNRLAYLRVEGLWDPVRADPRFDELVRRVGIPA